MSNIIEDFYYGNLEPQAVNSELTPKLKKKLSNLAEKEEQLTTRLNDEEKELFLNYASAYNEFSSKSNSDSFISDFRFGVKFTFDTFVNKLNEFMCVALLSLCNANIYHNTFHKSREFSTFFQLNFAENYVGKG